MTTKLREAPSVEPPRPAPGPDTRPVDAVNQPPILETRDLTVRFGEHSAIKGVSLAFQRGSVNAIIGPSGSGKSTLLRALNRMHDGIRAARIDGDVLLNGSSIYASDVDPIDLRRRVGMVFQRPNPFAMSIFDNVAFGLRGNHPRRAERQSRVESALRQAGLWDEVKDRLRQSAYRLSGGQQQRLCIARALAIEPEVLLMDEPSAALDPIATLRLEELMREIAGRLTVVVVTHSLEQAARASDTTAFLTFGELVEVGPTAEIFTNPRDRRTEDYISGRIG